MQSPSRTIDIGNSPVDCCKTLLPPGTHFEQHQAPSTMLRSASAHTYAGGVWAINHLHVHVGIHACRFTNIVWYCMTCYVLPHRIVGHQTTTNSCLFFFARYDPKYQKFLSNLQQMNAHNIDIISMSKINVPDWFTWRYVIRAALMSKCFYSHMFVCKCNYNA